MRPLNAETRRVERRSGQRFAAVTNPCDFIAFDGTHLTRRAAIEVVHQELFDKWLKGTRSSRNARRRWTRLVISARSVSSAT